MADAALVKDLYAQMGAVWAAEGTGSMEVGERYVQWGKYAGGLQIECVSNEYLEPDDQLSEHQLLALANLGFCPPDDDWPNHYRRFTSEHEIFDAALALSEVVTRVLPVEQPSRGGHVCVVVPVAKCWWHVLEREVSSLHAAVSVRTEASLLRVHAGPHDDEHVTDLGSWLHSQCLESPTALEILVKEEQPDLDTLLRGIGRLKDLGQRVMVVGPRLLPGDRRYLEAVNAVADGVITIGAATDYDLCRRECARLLTEDRPTLALTYGKEQPRLPAEQVHVPEHGDGSFVIEAVPAIGIPHNGRE